MDKLHVHVHVHISTADSDASSAFNGVRERTLSRAVPKGHCQTIYMYTKSRTFNYPRHWYGRLSPYCTSSLILRLCLCCTLNLVSQIDFPPWCESELLLPGITHVHFCVCPIDMHQQTLKWTLFRSYPTVQPQPRVSMWLNSKKPPIIRRRQCAPYLSELDYKHFASIPCYLVSWSHVLAEFIRMPFRWTSTSPSKEIPPDEFLMHIFMFLATDQSWFL